MLQHVVALFNRQHSSTAQVEPGAPAVPQPTSPPPVRAFWDGYSRCFRLAQWNLQYQRWLWIQ